LLIDFPRRQSKKKAWRELQDDPNLRLRSQVMVPWLQWLWERRRTVNHCLQIRAWSSPFRCEERVSFGMRETSIKRERETHLSMTTAGVWLAMLAVFLAMSGIGGVVVDLNTAPRRTVDCQYCARSKCL
jgi:hypothetical protein